MHKWSSVAYGEGPFLEESQREIILSSMATNRITQYFVDSFHELGKVTWPTRNRAINICILVISFVFVAAVVFAGVDFLLHEGFTRLIEFAQTPQA